MASSPVIMAVVRLQDELSPALLRMAESVEKAMKLSAEKFLPLEERTKRAQEEFKLLGATIKETFSAAVPREFSTALGSATREMNRLRTSTEETRRSAHGLRETFHGIAEAAKLVAGIEAGRLTKEGVVAGAELDRQQNMLRLMGLPPSALAILNSAANQAAITDPLTQKVKFLETYRDIAGVMPLTEEQKARGEHFNVEGATALTTTWARATSALAAFDAKASPSDLRNLLSVGEHMVNMSPEFLSKVVDSYVRASQSEGSLANSSSFRDLMTNMKAAGVSISEDFMLKTVPVLMTTNNPSRLGNELSQLSKMMTGSSLTKQQADWLVSLGLASKSQEHKVGSGPNNWRIDWGLADVARSQSNPLQWAIDKLRPALEHKVKDSDVEKLMAAARSRGETLTDEKARSQLIAAEIQRSGFRSSITDIDTHLAEAIPLIEQGMRRLAMMPGLDAGNQSPDAIRGWNELSAAVSGFTAVVTSAPMHDAGQTLHDWASWFGTMSKSVDEWAQKHSGWFDGTADTLGLGAKGVAGAVIGGGTAASIWLFTTMFTANTTATAANTSAIAANTAALMGGGVVGKTVGGVAGAAGGVLGFLGKWAGRAAALGGALGLTKAIFDYEHETGNPADAAHAGDFVKNTVANVVTSVVQSSGVDMNAAATNLENRVRARKGLLPVPLPSDFTPNADTSWTRYYEGSSNSQARISVADDAWDEKMRLARENYAQANPVPVNVTPTGSGTIELKVNVTSTGQVSVTPAGPAKINLNVGSQGSAFGDTLSRRREE